eukprot:373094-Rhodomonas_salina.1
MDGACSDEAASGGGGGGWDDQALSPPSLPRKDLTRMRSRGSARRRPSGGMTSTARWGTHRGDFTSLARAWEGKGGWLGEIDLGRGEEVALVSVSAELCLAGRFDARSDGGTGRQVVASPLSVPDMQRTREQRHSQCRSVPDIAFLW